MTTHAPATPATPFAIGLKPLERGNYLILDGELDRYRAEKRALYETKFDSVFMAQADMADSQSEALQLVCDALRSEHPELYRFDGALVRDQNNEITVDLEDYRDTPLAAAGLLVQDDLVLMRKRKEGWCLAAASLCFPSSWNLAEKFGKPMDAIHGPVPLPPNMGNRIARIFDNLRPDVPVWRSNWSLDGDGDLRHDRLERHRDGKREKLAGCVWLRTEYQTLHKLPVSGDILFTIRIASSPLDGFAETSDGRAQLAELLQQYTAMQPQERSYKGIEHGAERLVAWLKQQTEMAA